MSSLKISLLTNNPTTTLVLVDITKYCANIEFCKTGVFYSGNLCRRFIRSTVKRDISYSTIFFAIQGKDYGRLLSETLSCLVI